MSIQTMMQDRVNIYYLKERSGGSSYGVPEPSSYYYGDIPDLEDVRCSIQRATSSISQGEPFLDISEQFNLYLPIRTPIKERDMVEFNEVKFYAGIPIRYKNHIKVRLKRVEKI